MTISKISFALSTLLLGTVLTGCGSSDKIISDFVDNLDTDQSARITYINSNNNMVTFQAKSIINPLSVYDSKFRIRDQQGLSSSHSINQEWVGDANEIQFAAFDTNSNQARTEVRTRLIHNRDYYAISWSEGSVHKLSVLQRSPANNNNDYAVRFFTSKSMDIIDTYNEEVLLNTQAGEISQHIIVENCADLEVSFDANNYDLDLCATGTPGNSYLLTINDNGDMVMVQE